MENIMRINAYVYRQYLDKEKYMEIEVPGEFNIKTLKFNPDQIGYILEYGKVKRAVDLNKIFISDQEWNEIETYAFRWYISATSSPTPQSGENGGEKK